MRCLPAVRRPDTAHLDLLAVHTRASHAVVCGESALVLHDLIDDVPAAAHIAVPRARRQAISYPPTDVAQYAAKTFDLNMEQYEAAGVPIDRSPCEYAQTHSTAASTTRSRARPCHSRYPATQPDDDRKFRTSFDLELT